MTTLTFKPGLLTRCFWLLAVFSWHHGYAEVYRSYMTNPYCNSKKDIVTPSSIQELQTLVIRSGLPLFGTKLKAFGSRHSITDIICTDGTPISMANFNNVQVNEDGTATVGAGATVETVMKQLHSQGRTILHIPGFMGITVGGAVGTGAHGSSLRHPASLSDQIVSLRLINGLGVLRTISGEELDTIRIHLGLHGILVDVTLATVPAFKMEMSRNIYPDSILLDGTALEMTRNSDYMQMAWFPWFSEVLLVRGLQRDASTPGNAHTTLFTEMSAETSAAIQGAYDALQEMRHFNALHAIEKNSELSLFTKVVGRSPIFTEDDVTVQSPGVGWNWNATAGNCKSCYWTHGNNSLFNDEAEIGCDIKEFAGIIKTVNETLKRIPSAMPMVGIVLRFHPNSKAPLSMAYNRPNGVVIVDLIYPARSDYNKKPKAGLAAFQAISQALVYKHGGRPHWGKNGLGLFSKEVIEFSHDKKALQMVRTAMRLNDPLGVFKNKFARRFLGESDEMDANPEAVHCALRDTCFCQKDEDCAEEQFCEQFVDPDDGTHKYRVCRDRFSYEDKNMGPYDPYNLTDIFRAAFS